MVPFKLAYLGKRYNGFEHHANTVTPLPTIEEELWKAFNKARLIFPANPNPLNPGEVSWDGMDYSKCGRTDKGVSAFGQVIGIRVRSNRPLGKQKKATAKQVEGETRIPEENEGPVSQESVETHGNDTYPRVNGIEIASPSLDTQPKSNGDTSIFEPIIEDSDYEEALDFDPIKDEIPYALVLNKLLPPDIRILAWCPSPPIDFSARFSCQERQYRYYFTQPAFSPTPHHLENASNDPTRIKNAWLDIAAMREAAKLFEGVHDFRNFCKVDGGKQIENFWRRVFFADIQEVEDDAGVALAHVNGPDFQPATADGKPRVYTFTLHGSAFLWHQVRHMVAILFLVGQNLEKPEIVSQLLDVETNPRRPVYEMASETPLVLWDCIFPKANDPERKDALDWLYVGDGPHSGDAKYGTQGLMDDLWEIRRERKIDELLAGALMNAVAKQGVPPAELEVGYGQRGSKSQKLFAGGDAPKMQGAYIPVMKKPKMEAPMDINLKYAQKKGFEDSEDMKVQGYKRLNLQRAADAVEVEAAKAVKGVDASSD